MLLAGVVSVGALALGFAGDYLAVFLDVPVPLAATVFLVLLNMRGIKESMGANSAATIIEVSGLLLVIVLGVVVAARGQADLSRLTHLGTPTDGPVMAVLSGAVLAFYSYVGSGSSVNVAEEARDPRRSYPRALCGALLVAGLVYAGVGAAASAVVPTAELAASSGPLLEVVRIAGGVPLWLFGVIALMAVANGALLTGIMSSRLAYGMARDGLLPPVLGRVLPNRRTPWVAIIVTTGLSLVLALVGSIDLLASTLVLLLLVVFSTVNVAVLVLRKDPRGRADHFRVPTVLPVLGLVSCLLLFTQVEASTWVLGLPLLAVGGLLAWFASRSARATAATTGVPDADA